VTSKAIRGDALKAPAFLERLGVGVIDQSLSSVTTFVVSALIARNSSPDVFGAFGIAFSVYVVALVSARALCGEPYVIRHSLAGRSRRAAGLEMCGAAIGLGLAIGVAIVAVGTAILGPLGTALILVGIAMPGLLLQDSVRFVFFAGGDPVGALRNDALWAVLQLAGVAFLASRSGDTGLHMVGAWAAAGVVAGGCGVVQLRGMPRVSSAAAWLWAHRDINTRFLAETLLVSASSQTALFLVSWIDGLEAAASLRGVAMLFGPLLVLRTGLSTVLLPEAVRVAPVAPDRFWRLMIRVTVGCTGLAVSWAAAIWFLMPPSAGSAILGASWTATLALVPAFGFQMAASAAQAGPGIGLRSLAAARLTFRIRAVSAPAQLIAIVLGAFYGGAVGAAWALGLVLALACPFWWRALWGAQRSAEVRGEATDGDVALRAFGDQTIDATTRRVRSKTGALHVEG
jgi:hypothetical protein